MRMIEIAPLDNGAHRNQTCASGASLPAGWAVIPEELEIPGTFPFVGVTAEEIDGVMTVTALTPGAVPEPDLAPIKERKQEENKASLAAWLESHPLTWVDGNVYGVTEADQNEMALNLQQYQVQKAAGREAVLEWHTQKKQCHAFTEEQYTALLLAIIDCVYPYRRYQETVKEAIYASGTLEELEAVVIDYASVEASA